MKKINWLVSAILGLVSAIVYFASVADYAFPGEGARLMACWKGIDAVEVAPFPLMAVFAKLTGVSNVLAPICGALSVMLLFHLVAVFVASRIKNEAVVDRREGIARLAAASAAVVYMLTPAVRSAATHLEPRLFDFTWLLLSFSTVLPFVGPLRRVSPLSPVILGVFAAFGACDTVLFIVFLPLFVFLSVRVAMSSGRNPVLAAFFLLLAFFVTLVSANAGFDVPMVEFLRRSAGEFKAYGQAQGWVFVAIFATVPFFMFLFSSGRAYAGSQGVVQWIYHGALTFISILAIATPLAPSVLMEPYAVLPVLTCAFAAVTAGYLLSYWWVYRNRPLGMVGGGVLAFVLVVSSGWNVFVFDGSKGAFADKVARKIIADLGERKWFISDGTLDHHLALVAEEMGRELNLISLNRDLDEPYLERLSKLVEEKGIAGSKNGALRLSLTLGVLPFVQDWFAADPDVANEVAIFGAPDLWMIAGITPVPEFFFFGADEKRVPDWSAWKEFDVLLSAPKGWGSYRERQVSSPVDRMRFSLRRHLGFVANNRGVYLQDKGRDDEAFAMYELVLNEIDHDNICAIFNEVGMVGTKHSAAMAKQRDLERMLKTVVEDTNRRYILWRLGTYYGYIRNPEVFVRLGHSWARSGRPGDALSQIRRAIDFVPSDRRAALYNMMAALYANENNQRKSREIYQSVLSENANDHDALIGLMRLELLDGNSARALELLQRAAKVSGEGKEAQLELAMVSMMKNDLTTAKAMIKKALDFNRKDLQVWSLLAAVTMQQIDAEKNAKAKAELFKELERSVLPTMEQLAENPHDYYLQATKGYVLLQQGDSKRKEARDAFVSAMKARPDITTTQDMVLGLDISLDDKANAEIHARDVLRRNRNAPLANYVMGSLSLGRGKMDEAEAFLRKAAEAPQPVALALNDLAEVLRRKRSYADAERYARKATERQPSLYVAWETLGAVLMDADRNLDEAEACIRKACELSKTKEGREADVRMLVSLARVQIRNGDRQHAKVTIRKVQSRLSELSEYEKREFENVRKSVR